MLSPSDCVDLKSSMNELVMTKCEKVVECDFLFSREKIGGCAHYRGQIFKPFPSPHRRNLSFFNYDL